MKPLRSLRLRAFALNVLPRLRHPAALLALGVFALYAATLLPGVGGGDTAEFQRVGPTLGLAHSTGYPLYSLLGWLWSRLLPLGAPAWRMNLLSAAAATGAVVAVYRIGRGLGAGRILAAGGALALALSLSLWRQATQAEIYALAACLEGAFFAALLAWRAGRAPLWPAGMLAGLMLVHHRTAVFLFPGALLFVLLSRRPRPREVGLAILAAVAMLPIYLYVPWRAAPWQDGWQILGVYVGGGVGREWLRPGQLWGDGWGRLAELARLLIIPQFTWAGLALAGLGAGRLLRRDRGAAALLLSGYGLVFAFCAAYYVDDLDVFMIAGHLIQAILMLAGGQALLDAIARRLPEGRSALLPLAFWLLPLILLARNLPAVSAQNTAAPETLARQRLGQPLAAGALVIGDGFAIESLRYLQAVEGLRPDLEFGFNADPGYIRAALGRGRPVYLLQPAPGLGLRQELKGGFWQVSDAPLAADTPADARWDDGIRLSGYSLPAGPFRAGDSVLVTLEWQAAAAPGRDYTFFLHLVDAGGALWGQSDSPPAGGPTAGWAAGSTRLEIAAPAFKPDAPPGTYRVLLGWYDPASTQRLPLAGGAETLELGRVEVVGE
ncbi:MAG TPA: DUF2723 domain-containing protein [Herpetosiphonaceae bacterium]|nr:DUF2723 domain-containing protein [Herpetosiphonaceae bacterium]